MPSLRWRRTREGEKVRDYTNSQIAALIDEHIHSERDRALLKRRLIDGICFEPLAEEFQISTRHCKTLVYKLTDRIVKYL
jgi:AraC-like DNA-binding protein